MIRAFIFDLDGVITDTAEYHYRGWKRLAEEEGLSFTRADNEHLRGIPRRESLMLILKDRVYPEAGILEMMERKNNYYLEFIKEISPHDLLPGAKELLEETRAAGLKNALGSASRNAREVLDRLGIRHLFDAISDGHSVERQKPAPDLFLHAAQQLGLPPTECVVIEDAAAGIEAARAGGFRSVGLGPRERVGAAEAVFPDLSAVRLADLLRDVDQTNTRSSLNEIQKEKTMNSSIEFPQGFLWGTATAAHQVEGNNVNSDVWVFEHMPKTFYVDPSGDACDHYHRYRSDIALLAELGFNAYRFSIEWARIEPEEGEFSLAVLEHYRDMLRACQEHSITPIVTFHHFSSPRWLMSRGGWESKKTPDRFARYCERAARYLGDLIGAACTINEANIASVITKMGFASPLKRLRKERWWLAASEALGVSPKRLSSFMYAASSKAEKIILRAHHRALEAIKSASGNFPVGITLALQDIQAVEGGEKFAARMRKEINDVYLESLKGDDFVGVQAYSRSRVGPGRFLPPEEGVELTEMHYEFWPEALEATIRDAATKSGLPVLVTENGIATTDDTRRMEYVRRALQGVSNCLKDGIPVRGYTYWSAFDNFEWSLGYRPTFGLIAVNRETQERTVKPSARWLGGIARANTLEQS